MNKLIDLGKVSRETQDAVLRCVSPTQPRADFDNTGHGDCGSPSKACQFVSSGKAPMYPDCI